MGSDENSWIGKYDKQDEVYMNYDQTSKMLGTQPSPCIIAGHSRLRHQTPSTTSISGLCIAPKPPSSSAVIGRSSSLLASQAPSLKVGGIRVAHPSTTRCSIIRMNCFPNAKANANALNITFEDQATDQLKMLEKAVKELIEDLLTTCQVTSLFIARQRMWENIYKSIEHDSEHWYKESQHAFVTGDPFRGYKLLVQQNYYADTAAKLKSKSEKLQGEVENFVNKIRLIETNIQATISLMDSIKALKQSSETNIAVYDIWRRINVTQTLAKFIELEKIAMSCALRRIDFDQLIANESKGKICMPKNLSLADTSESLKEELSEERKFWKGQSLHEKSILKERFGNIEISYWETFSRRAFTRATKQLYEIIKFLMSKGLWLDDFLESLENEILQNLKKVERVSNVHMWGCHHNLSSIY